MSIVDRQDVGVFISQIFFLSSETSRHNFWYKKPLSRYHFWVLVRGIDCLVLQALQVCLDIIHASFANFIVDLPNHTHLPYWRSILFFMQNQKNIMGVHWANWSVNHRNFLVQSIRVDYSSNDRPTHQQQSELQYIIPLSSPYQHKHQHKHQQCTKKNYDNNTTQKSLHHLLPFLPLLQHWYND